MDFLKNLLEKKKTYAPIMETVLKKNFLVFADWFLQETMKKVFLVLMKKVVFAQPTSPKMQKN